MSIKDIFSKAQEEIKDQVQEAQKRMTGKDHDNDPSNDWANGHTFGNRNVPANMFPGLVEQREAKAKSEKQYERAVGELGINQSNNNASTISMQK